MYVKLIESDEDGNFKINLINFLVCFIIIYKCFYIDVNILVII